MGLYPSTISIDSHNHSVFDRRPAVKDYECRGCKEHEFNLQECYQCRKCDLYYFHKECVPSPYPFYLELLGCDLTFHPDPPSGNPTACDACGMTLKGSFYGGISRGKPKYLHPCCAKLAFKETDTGGVVLDLKEKSSSLCLICGNQGNSRDFKSWVYKSRSGDYCYHVACVKSKVETWKATTAAEEASNQHQRSYGAGASISGGALPMVPSQRTQGGSSIRPGGGRGKTTLILKTAVEIFNIVVSLLFGLPPIPFDLVIKWLKWLK